jgi:hypothetical protein
LKLDAALPLGRRLLDRDHLTLDLGKLGHRLHASTFKENAAGHKITIGYYLSRCRPPSTIRRFNFEIIQLFP